jgi:hypothetical protein
MLTRLRVPRGEQAPDEDQVLRHEVDDGRDDALHHQTGPHGGAEDTVEILAPRDLYRIPNKFQAIRNEPLPKTG